jgi:hypothetical protein
MSAHRHFGLRTEHARQSRAAFWTIAVPLAIAFAFSLMGAGYFCLQNIVWMLTQ